MKVTIATIVFIFHCMVLTAQNNSYFNDYFDNSQFNTAYNSLYKGFSFSFLGYKNQNLSNSPGYFSIKGNYTNKEDLSFGVKCINKNLGFQNFYLGEFSLNKRIALTKNDSISFAISMGAINNGYNMSNFNQYTELDPLIDQVQKSYFTSGAGLLFTHKNKLEIGISAPILATSNHGLKPMIYANAGYVVKASKFKIKPQIIYEKNVYEDLFDFSARVQYLDHFWVKVATNTYKSKRMDLGFDIIFWNVAMLIVKIHRSMERILEVITIYSCLCTYKIALLCPVTLASKEFKFRELYF